jgi:hypothetical protein
MGRQLRNKTLGFIAFLILASCGEFVGILPDEDAVETGLPSVKISLSPDEMSDLYDSVTLDLAALCAYEMDGIRGWGEINVRGFTSRMNPKKSFTLLLEDEETKIALDAGGDPWMSYNLIMYAYEQVGLPAPQLSPATLFLNGEHMGYYSRLPLYDSSIDDFFGEKGELFKIRVFDIGQDVPTQSMSEKKYPDDDDYSSLNLLLVNAAHMSTDDWVSWIEDHVDLENVARYMVVRDFFGSADTYNTNFYIYAGDSYRILPWDNDHYYRYESIGGDNLLTTRMLESPLFQEHYKSVFNKYFLQSSEHNIIDSLKSYLETLYADLEEAVDLEPVFYLKSEDFDWEREFILSFLDDRADTILADPEWSGFFDE